MTNNDLETLRDLVCAEISSDSIKMEHQELKDALTLIPIRDGVLRYLYDTPSARTNAQTNLNLLLAQTVAHEQAALATILAGCTWLDSDLKKTSEALALALKADSTYSLARLLDVALTHGVPPKVWADSLAAVSPEQCLTGAA